MEAVHKAKLDAVLADFERVDPLVCSIIKRYQVRPSSYNDSPLRRRKGLQCSPSLLRLQHVHNVWPAT